MVFGASRIDFYRLENPVFCLGADDKSCALIVGGWKAAKALVKGDERILGDSDFVLNVLSECNEQFERKYRLVAKGIDLDGLARYVAGMFDLKTDDLFSPGRYPKRVKARSLLFYWAVRELGMTATDLGKKQG